MPLRSLTWRSGTIGYQRSASRGGSLRLFRPLHARRVEEPEHPRINPSASGVWRIGAPARSLRWSVSTFRVPGPDPLSSPHGSVARRGHPSPAITLRRSEPAPEVEIRRSSPARGTARSFVLGDSTGSSAFEASLLRVSLRVGGPGCSVLYAHGSSPATGPPAGRKAPLRSGLRPGLGNPRYPVVCQDSCEGLTP